MSYRWSIGQTSRYQVHADLSGSVPIMNNVEPIQLDATLDITYRITPRAVADDGSTTVEFRIEKAEAELAKIPLPVPFEDAQKVLNRSVVLHKTGTVRSVSETQPLPFGVSIPGVDPQRLYTLIYPIVFPERPIRPGDRWTFESELLGAEGAPATFTATVLEPQANPKANTRRPGPVPPAEPLLRVREEFSMAVDQKLNADKAPVVEGDTPRKTRVGQITGSGVMAFSRKQGKLVRGYLTILAKISERYVGEPPPDEPAEIITDVKAVVRISPVPVKTTAPRGKPAATPSRRNTHERHLL